ncbi:putative Ig domain-containing protein, partial [Brenneria populi]|nr:putative Ig domain-containing protein [Brenneria populi Li et al. 2015]
TVVISSAAGMSAADAAGLIDGLAYVNASVAPTEGARAVTLRAIQDNGGGADSAALNLAAAVNVVAVNSAPQATDTAVTLPEATRAVPYSATLPAELFSDADGDTLTWRIEGLPNGLTFDADTLTISGTPLATGSVQLVVTASDAQGATATRTVALAVNQPAAAPVILPEFDAFGMMNGWREELERREAPLKDGGARPTARSAPPAPALTAAPAPQPGDALSISQYPLANGEIDYAQTPWRLDPIMETLMPPLEAVDFSSLRGAAAAAQENALIGQRTPLPDGAAGKAAFSAQLQQEQSAFDALLIAVNQLAEKNASPAQ